MSVKEKIELLRPMLDLSDLALKEPDEGTCPVLLKNAEKWLDKLIKDRLPQFDEVYYLTHTGEDYWRMCKASGLKSKDGMMSDLPCVIKMRKVLKKFNKRFHKNVPVIFGGNIEEAEAKAEARSRDTSKDYSQAPP